ncbi:hypothetical protein FHU36_004164 [Nonomuraea muscovyensis]|uniref:Uncharacterized protein n=1 Tax=Nonomuraea muscovyensis TaxID=1124761 RepID=A0A7X0C347_9ACTN|nr:hypothetical protein [Nonomuraea muscovyensis]
MILSRRRVPSKTLRALCLLSRVPSASTISTARRRSMVTPCPRTSQPMPPEVASPSNAPAPYSWSSPTQTTPGRTGTNGLLLVEDGRVKRVPTALHGMDLVQEISRLLRAENVTMTKLGTDLILWHVAGGGRVVEVGQRAGQDAQDDAAGLAPVADGVDVDQVAAEPEQLRHGEGVARVGLGGDLAECGAVQGANGGEPRSIDRSLSGNRLIPTLRRCGHWTGRTRRLEARSERKADTIRSRPCAGGVLICTVEVCAALPRTRAQFGEPIRCDRASVRVWSPCPGKPR